MLDNFVYGLRLTVTLWEAHRGKPFLYTEVLTEIYHFIAIKLLSIVRYELIGNPVSTNDCSINEVYQLLAVMEARGSASAHLVK